MVKHLSYSFLIIAFYILMHPFAGKASEHRGAVFFTPGGLRHASFLLPVADTIPASKPTPENVPAQKKDELIKEVPRAKKQEKPMAVLPVNVKPVVVKPKVIIKPIIKIH